MSALTLTIAELKLGAVVTAIAGNRIYPGHAPQNAAPPMILVHLIAQPEEYLLQGASQWPEARVSIECRGATINDADRLGEAVIVWLRDKTRVTLSGQEVTFRKEGSDVTDFSTQSENGDSYVQRRILDYYVRSRVIA